MRTKEERTCLNCDKPFQALCSDINRGGGKYCCRQCSHIAIGYKKRKRLKRHCIYCKSEFEVILSEVMKGSGKYCSRRCTSLGTRTERHRVWVETRRPNISAPYQYEDSRVISVYLTEGHRSLIDEEDVVLVGEFLWKYNKGYAERTVGGDHKTKYKSIHRLVMNAPDDMEVDHINGNRLDNRKKNLRLVSRAQNCQNVHVGRGRSRVRGVHWIEEKQTWRATIKSNGKVHNLGYYKTVEEAKNVVEQKRRDILPFSSI